jgi:hypothetical protein
MEAASLSVMDDDRNQRDALAAAGYTSARGAVLFCAVLAVVGALLGSVVLAILGNILIPGIPPDVGTAMGAAGGAGLGILLGLVKIRQGNLEARELIEDKEWRREALRRYGDKPQ